MTRFIATLALAGAFLLGAVVPPLQAQTKNATEAQIRKLIEVTDATAQTRKMIPAITRQIWSQLLKRVPNVTDAAKKEITEKMAAAMEQMAPAFVELTIPIYQRHLTADEADAAIAFYSTPLGKSFASKAAQIGVEAVRSGMALGQQMAARAARIAVENLRRKGYQL